MVATGERRPGVVLIHGAFHSAACWAPTVNELERQAPDLAVLPVDLPGRGGTPADLRTVTLASCVEHVVAEIDRVGLDPVVVVAHSLGGLTAPAVVARLGAPRVARLVLIAAVIPPDGASDLDLMPQPARSVMARVLRPGRERRPPARPLARLFFCNGMNREQRQLVYAQLTPEATNLFSEPVDRSGLPDAVPRTWVLTRRDRSMLPSKQRAAMRDLGRVDEVIELDTCHDAMVSQPDELARVLLRR
ncbi:MAG: alpha/beta hydrolase [Nitriliruptor sp.]|nr:MAG: alpha/beta hydrolase [Nitriliruptor sp.]